MTAPVERQFAGCHATKTTLYTSTAKKWHALEIALMQKGLYILGQVYDVVQGFRKMMDEGKVGVGERDRAYPEALQRQFRWDEHQTESFWHLWLEIIDKKAAIKLCKPAISFEAALKEKGFPMAAQIAEQYRTRVVRDDCSYEELLMEFKDPNPSRFIEDMQDIFQWNQQKAEVFQRLVMRLMDDAIVKFESKRKAEFGRYENKRRALLSVQLDKQAAIQLDKPAVSLEGALEDARFDGAAEIAKMYRTKVVQEHYDCDVLLTELRDASANASWFIEDMQNHFRWTDTTTDRFKDIVLRLVEMVRLLQTRLNNPQLVHALNKLEQIKKNQRRIMPLYMNRAIFWRSDDEILDQLIDHAVYTVSQLDMWNDSEFVRNIYDDGKFVDCVHDVFMMQFKERFFAKFVELKYFRQIQLQSLKHEHVQDELMESNAKHGDEVIEPRLPRMRRMGDADGHEYRKEYVLYYRIKRDSNDEKEEETKCNESVDVDENEYEYHIYQIRRILPDEHQHEYVRLCNFLVPHGTQPGYDWFWWKNSAKDAVARAASTEGITTNGYWDALNHERINQQNITKNGVSVQNLNIVLALLREYHVEDIRGNATRLLTDDTDPDPTLLHVLYCQGEFVPVAFSVDVYIHDEDHDDNDRRHFLYELTWWNNAKPTECNCIAIKNKSAKLMLDWDQAREHKIREKFYMCMKTDVLNDNDESTKIEWFWWDNDGERYELFKDYGADDIDENKFQENLLWKQFEATLSSNEDRNYPWKLFDVFNNAQITHLKPLTTLAPPARYRRAPDGPVVPIWLTTPKGYCMRFSRLYDKSDYKPVNIIVNVEQVAINPGFTFSRNIRKLIGGEDALSETFRGSSVNLVNLWLQNYSLSNKDQRKFFWAYILVVCMKIKQTEIEIEAQMVNTAKYESFVSGYCKSTDLFTFEGQNADDHEQLHEGFFLPPNSDGDVIVEDRSHIAVLRKAIKREEKQLKQHGEADVVWLGQDDDQYSNSTAVMMRFAELIRKFILEAHCLNGEMTLWPFFKNYDHQSHKSVYHSLINQVDFSNLLPRLPDVVRTATQNVRHKRKTAAQQLLQKWESLRIINFLKQQLEPLLILILEEAEVEIARDLGAELEAAELDTVNDLTATFSSKQQIKQMRLVEMAERFTPEKWKRKIAQANLRNNLCNFQSGLRITSTQVPFFESFLRCFVLKNNEEQSKTVREDMFWYRHFKQQWRTVPVWWTSQHDIILIELALKHSDHWEQYQRDIQDINAPIYRLRLTSSNASSTDKTYFEFTHWLRQQSNILHRLRYLTSKLMSKLSSATSAANKELVFSDDAIDESCFLFSCYEKNKHIQYVLEHQKLQEAREPRHRNPRWSELLERRKVIAIPYVADGESESSDSSEDDASVSLLEEKASRFAPDSFLKRDLLEELREAIHMFDIAVYGPHMARFVVNTILQYNSNVPELWDILGVVLNTLPFSRSMNLLQEEMIDFCRDGRESDSLFKVCDEMVC